MIFDHLSGKNLNRIHKVNSKLARSHSIQGGDNTNPLRSAGYIQKSTTVVVTKAE